MNRRSAFARYQRSIRLFSRDVVGVPLHPYQWQWADYVLEVVAEGRNETVTVEMPRQSGKNETSAQLEALLLARFGGKGGAIVKCAPTWKPQIVNSKLRLEQRAAQVQARLPFLKFRPRMGYMMELGRASIAFLSADPSASVVGATASLLMEVDEAQDVSEAKFDKDFSPMRASTGAPIVAYGTTWTDDTLLERFKLDVREGRAEGRVIRIPPEVVADSNPSYGDFVDSEVDRLGREHPLVKTQYFLEALETRGRLISPQQLRLMAGTHERRDQRSDEPRIVAGLDFAGADEDAGTPEAMLKAASSRDSVALSIGAVHWVHIAQGIVEPTVLVMARYEWLNQHPSSLHGMLYQILWNQWRVDRVHCDETGVGETSTRLLQRAINRPNRERVHGVKFDSAWNAHTRLATDYLAMVNGGRLRDYQTPGLQPIAEAGRKVPHRGDVDRHVWWQRGHAKLEARPGRRAYRIYVPEKEGHDDLILAEMLMVDAAYQLDQPLKMQSSSIDWYNPNANANAAPEPQPTRSEDEIERLLSEAHGE